MNQRNQIVHRRFSDLDKHYDTLPTNSEVKFTDAYGRTFKVMFDREGMLQIRTVDGPLAVWPESTNMVTIR